MILDQEQVKCGMPTGGVNTRNGLKKLSNASRGSQGSAEGEDQQPLNETVDNSVGGAPDSRKSSKQQSAKAQVEDAPAETANSARSSKKRKIQEISHDDANALSPSQSRKKMMKPSPTKVEDLTAKEEFVSLPSKYLKPSSSQDASVADAFNLNSLKEALPEESAPVVVSSSSDD